MKYELIPEGNLFRLKALKDFGEGPFKVLKGDLGGLVSGEHNLSQDGTCWVYDSAQVSGSAQVFHSAQVSGSAQVYGSALVYGSAQVFHSAQVFGSARVFGEALVYGSAEVFGSALVSGSARVSGSAQVWDKARVSDSARVFGSAQVSDSARVFGSALVSGSAQVLGEARVFDSAEVTKCLFVQQPRYNLTATNTHVFVGCEGHTWEHWEAEIENIGKNHMYSDQEILDTKQILTVLRRQLCSNQK